MKNRIKVFGNLNRARSAKAPLLIIAFVAVFGFTFAACEDGTGGGGPGGPGGGGGGGGASSTSGSLTITGIPTKYNGKYMSGGGTQGTDATDALHIFQFNNNAGKPGRISGGTVALDVLKFTSTWVNFNASGEYNVTMAIYRTQNGSDMEAVATGRKVNFTGGKATVSYNDFNWTEIP